MIENKYNSADSKNRTPQILKIELAKKPQFRSGTWMATQKGDRNAKRKEEVHGMDMRKTKIGTRNSRSQYVPGTSITKYNFSQK